MRRPPDANSLSLQAEDDGADESLVASLEPALWKRLADGSSTEDIARAWLALQCQMVEGATRGLLVLAGKAKDSYDAVASWPEGAGHSTALAEIATSAIRENRGVASNDGDPAHAPAWLLNVALPITLDKKLQGAVALSIRAARPDDGRTALRQLQWGTAWIRDRLRQARAEEQDNLIKRSSAALELIGSALDREGFEASAMAVVTELAVRTQCSRVSLGFRTGASVAVKIISHTAQFGQQMNLVNCLGAAMDEALDQRSVILYPSAEDKLLATSAHAELSSMQHDGQILTIPLLAATDYIGALTFERPPNAPFTHESIELLELVTSTVGPVLEEKRQNDRWIVSKLGESIQNQFMQLVGPGHLLRKLVVGLAVIAALLVTFVHITYRVDADAKVEGLVRRAVVAPYDGFIKEAMVRAGDTVTDGEVMATLEDRDLLLDRLKWVTERQQHNYEYDKALAARQPATINVIRAQIDQADAQIQLIDEQLARIKLRSSLAGLVITGDLSQLIGASVQRGQVLFEVAPLDSYRIILGVDEREIGRIELGQIGHVVLSALPNDVLPFTVSKITPLAEAQSGRNLFRVEGRMTGDVSQLRPGMEGVGKVDIGQKSLAWIWLHPLLDWLRVWSWHWMN